MRFSFGILNQWRGKFSLNLATLLPISWWIVFGICIALLFLDGILFYLYGLGYAGASLQAQGSGEVVRLRKESIQRAASAIETARSQFNGSSTAPTDFTNPFK